MRISEAASPLSANNRGVSLVELMVAMTIMSIGILAGFGSFRFITKAMHMSRTRTIATNIVQEKMEVLKNYSYFQLLVTSATTINSDYSPALEYDNSNYPPESISLWGFPAFTRAVHVAYANMSGTVVSTVSFSSNDTGLKKVTVYVFWKEGDTHKKVEIHNLFANPSAAGLDSGFNGNVTVFGGGALPGAVVEVVGNANWLGRSDSAGAYSFTVARGSYSLICSSAGYFSQITPTLAAHRAAYTSKDFALVKMASGTVRGTVWVSSAPLISQVVASSGTFAGGEIEWVELYNPTTYPWTINSSNLELRYREKNGGAGATTVNLTYNNTTLPARGFYLIASTSPITVQGVSVLPDAVYATQDDVIKDNSDGGIGIRKNSSSEYWDRMAWKKSSGPDPPTEFIEGSELSLFPGLQDGEQFIRYASTAGAHWAYGNAYDTDDNTYNFTHWTSPLGPRNSSTTLLPIAGRPAIGAYVASSDGLSDPAQAVSSGGSAPYAEFTLTNVATGTWNVIITHDLVQLDISTVIVSNTGDVVRIPNGQTVSSWPVSGYNSAILVSTTSGGFVKGYVYGTNVGTRLNNILMEAGGITGRTSSNGYYFLNVPAGDVDVVANLNLANSNYASDSKSAVVYDGQVTTIDDIFLSQSGTIRGYVTSGTGALPNIVVKAQVGVREYAATTDGTGHFYINASTSSSAYAVSPVLDPLQTYTTDPDPMNVSLTLPGSTVVAGTITVTGGMGSISGSVTSSSRSITTGVLIVASIGSVADPPPSIAASSAPALSNPFYGASSRSDGTYRLEVRAGTYNVKAFYPIVNPTAGTVGYSTDSEASVSVTAGTDTPGINFSW